MKPIALVTLALAALSLPAAAKKLEVKDLPAAVQKTVTETAKGADIKTIGKETEDGVAQYEIETLLNGKHRDFNVDTRGKLLVLEDETSIDAIPAPARAAILKKVGAGKLRTVESVTKPGEAAMYEAAYTTKAGKHAEVLVKADGVETKD